MAEGGALQAGGLGGQGLRLQLKGVTKGACSQAVESLDSNPGQQQTRQRTKGIGLPFIKPLLHAIFVLLVHRVQPKR